MYPRQNLASRIFGLFSKLNHTIKLASANTPHGLSLTCRWLHSFLVTAYEETKPTIPQPDDQFTSNIFSCDIEELYSLTRAVSSLAVRVFVYSDVMSWQVGSRRKHTYEHPNEIEEVHSLYKNDLSSEKQSFSVP